MAFFEDVTQTETRYSTRIQSQSIEIEFSLDLVYFDLDSISTINDNLNKPRERIPDLNFNAALGDTMYTPAFVFEAKSQMRLAATCDIARYYTIVGRDTSVANIRCNPVIRNFKD